MDDQLKRAILILFIAGPPVLLWLYAYSGISRHVAMRSWPRTVATVQDARVTGPLMRGLVPLEVLASYEVGGKPTKAWLAVPMRAVPMAERRPGPPVPYDYLDEKFAVGKPLDVFYNPEQPDEAHYLVPALRPSFVQLAAGFVWLIACAIALRL